MANLTLFFNIFIYYAYLHVSSITVLIIRRSNWINTSSGMISLCEWLLGMTGIPSSHSYRLIIPDDVLIQFDILMMSTMMLETCREIKWITKYMKKCIRLVINKNLWIVNLDEWGNWLLSGRLLFINGRSVSPSVSGRPLEAIKVSNGGTFSNL